VLDVAAQRVILGQGRDKPLGGGHLNARDANDELAADSRCGNMQGVAWSSWARTSYSHMHLGWVSETPDRRQRSKGGDEVENAIVCGRRATYKQGDPERA
jgi:hypothetical protein